MQGIDEQCLLRGAVQVLVAAFAPASGLAKTPPIRGSVAGPTIPRVHERLGQKHWMLPHLLPVGAQPAEIQR